MRQDPGSVGECGVSYASTRSEDLGAQQAYPGARVPNMVATDGAPMASRGGRNPSLTSMALSARGAHRAAGVLREGNI